MKSQQKKQTDKRWAVLVALFIAHCSLFISGASAQVFIGYLSHDSILKTMPQLIIVEAEMDSLRQAYEKEMQQVEKDFNEKYEAFLEGRKDFPRTIMLKRQTELQQLLQRNLEFKAKSLEELEKARHEAMVPLQDLVQVLHSSLQQKHSWIQLRMS